MPRFQINRRPLLRLAASLALAAGLSPALTPAFAQTQVQVPGGEVYPSKVVTIIVPYAAGSPPDQYSRVFAEKLRPRIGQNVIIENRPGALTTVGMGFAARAKPDGYTIVYGSNSSLAAAPWLFKSIQYDPVKSFTPVSLVGRYIYVLVASPTLPAKDVNELLAYARANPGKLGYGSYAEAQREARAEVTALLQTAGQRAPVTIGKPITGGRARILDRHRQLADRLVVAVEDAPRGRDTGRQRNEEPHSFCALPHPPDEDEGRWRTPLGCRHYNMLLVRCGEG